jgi:hypothetical protein
MRKMAKLYTLLGILLVVCAAAFAVSRYEGKKEQIKNSGEVILEIPTENVTAVSWTNASGTFSFSKDEKWIYDDDNAFPADEDKINDLLEQFESFAAAFTIDDVEDFSQYGLDDPVCKISITAGDESYNIELGDFSKMDEQRYISIGDGKVYLATHDPLDEYDAVLRDMILDDTLPEFDTVQQIDFSGSENYTIVRDESIKSICEDDIFFADDQPLDTDNVNSFLSSVQSLSLTNYVSYNVSDEELENFGLNEPELTINLEYAVADDDGNIEDTGSLTLHVSRNPEELAEYEKAVEKEEEDLPKVTCYARIGESQIVYEISQSEYDSLTACGYNILRHQELFTADFDTATSIDVRLNGETYTFGYETPESKKDDEEGTWKYNGEEFDVQNLKSSLSAISASDFTDETPDGQEEISLTVHLDNEDFPEFTLTLYRYDGTNCIAEVDGKSVAFVSRDNTVALVEAVNKLILGS